MRTPIIAGNWKLNKTIEEARSFVRELAPLVSDASGVEVLLCRSSRLYRPQPKRTGHQHRIGAQDMYWKDSGAYTGEVSAPLLLDAACHTWCWATRSGAVASAFPNPISKARPATSSATATSR
jgi:triosephosphate isomerase